MTRTDTLRDRLVELRATERQLVEAAEAVAVQLVATRAEVDQVKSRLVAEGSVSLRLSSASNARSARGTLARMQMFTMSEAVAELGWAESRIKKLFAAMMCEVPPALATAGRVSGRAVWEYIGPAVDDADPEAEREAAALEAVRDWAVTQADVFTPAQAAAGCGLPRPTTLRALRALDSAGIVNDEGPTEDMPLFRAASSEAVDVAITPPPIAAVPEPMALSSIPAIQEMLDAAERAGAQVTPSNGHFAIEALDGRRVVIAATPRGRSLLLQDKARLRRIGIEV